MNPSLYATVKAAAKRKFAVYPSAYANAWLVREYNKTGGKYTTKSGGTRGRKRKSLGAAWVVGSLRSGLTLKLASLAEGRRVKRDGCPACRPSKRVSSKTPKTTGEMSPSEKAKFKREKKGSAKIKYQHKRRKKKK